VKYQLCESEKSSFSLFRVLGQRRVEHFACQTRFASISEGFCDILRELDVVCVAKVIAPWKLSTPSAERIRIALELIVEEHCSRRYQKLLLQLLSQPETCNLHCIVVNIAFVVLQAGTIIMRHFLTINCQFWDTRIWKSHHQISRVTAS